MQKKMELYIFFKKIQKTENLLYTLLYFICKKNYDGSSFYTWQSTYMLKKLNFKFFDKLKYYQYKNWDKTTLIFNKYIILRFFYNALYLCVYRMKFSH